MAVRGSVPPGADVRIVFRARPDNVGTSVVGSGWKGTGDRQAQDSFLIPGDSATHTHSDPGATSLRLHLDVPTGGGVIDVEVSVDGALSDTWASSTDGFSTYVVQ